tara:strand:- start:119 stop:379 length:261 start_codon:yes stop_codon:yes gene_type:complete
MTKPMRVVIAKHHDPDFEPWFTVEVVAIHSGQELRSVWKSRVLHSRDEAQKMAAKLEKVKPQFQRLSSHGVRMTIAQAIAWEVSDA